MDDVEVEQAMERVEAALAGLEGLPPAAAGRVQDAVGALVAVYGEALGRLASTAGAADPEVLHRCCDDELVAHLLALHGAHPDPVAARVASAAKASLASFGPQGLRLEDVAVIDAVAHLHFAGGDDRSTASRASYPALRGALETAVLGAAPELEEVRFDGIIAPSEEATEAVISVESILRRSHDPSQATA